MPAISTIVTHPGSAHKDEFLACSVLLTQQNSPIIRREPTAADMADPSVCVVDVGHLHDPALNKFDHHQLPKDSPPTCSLSLVLKNLGFYEDAREFCEWLEPAEWFDCRGPFATAEWLGVDREILAKLNSPIDGALLRLFSNVTRLDPDMPLWEIMKLIGQDLVEYLKTLRERLAQLETCAEFWKLEIGGQAAEVIFIPRTDPLLDDPSLGLDRFIHRRGRSDSVIGTVTPDRRGAGYGLSRFRDNARLDFTRIAGNADVHFAHARGFVAKTSASHVDRLKALLTQAGGG